MFRQIECQFLRLVPRPQRSVQRHGNGVSLLIGILYDLLERCKRLEAVRHAQCIAAAPSHHIFYIISACIRGHDHIYRRSLMRQILKDKIHKKAVLMPEPEYLAVPVPVLFIPPDRNSPLDPFQIISEEPLQSVLADLLQPHKVFLLS